MQMNKFIVRLATYHDGGFKEGVSLTVYDELARWEKYVSFHISGSGVYTDPMIGMPMVAMN